MFYEPDFTPLEKIVLERIESDIPSLKDHLVGTRNFALEINSIQSLGFDEESVGFASLCHDLARLKTPDEIIEELSRRGIDFKKTGFVSPILAHGLLSAEMAIDLGVSDEKILDAIRWHVTGREGMSLFEKLIYVADKLEPNRIYRGVEKLRELALENLEESFLPVIASVIEYIVAENLPPDYNSVSALNREIKNRYSNPKG